MAKDARQDLRTSSGPLQSPKAEAWQYSKAAQEAIDAMAKDVIEIPRNEWQALQARLEALEGRAATPILIDAEPHAVVLDRAFEAKKAEWSKPTSVRTQEKADRQWGLTGPRWDVHLQSRVGEDGKPLVSTAEYPKVRLGAHSKEEAVGRYQQLCGILSTEHVFVAEPVTANAV